MKHKIQKVELFVGVIVLLGGLLTYGLGVHQLLPVPRPDLVVYGTTLIGIILILMGCDIFSKPTKEMQILENDERNIAITNASEYNEYFSQRICNSVCGIKYRIQSSIEHKEICILSHFT